MRKSPFTTFPLSEDAEKHLLNVAESSPSKLLAVCQAKGKYNRLLEQQLDVMTELDNAVDALKGALKF